MHRVDNLTTFMCRFIEIWEFQPPGTLRACLVLYKDSLTFHRLHLALQPFVGFRLLSQVSPSSSILSCLLPVFYFQLF